MTERNLTPKQAKFVIEYCSDEHANGTQAAIRAYGCSKESAKVIASENLARPYIQEAIEERKRQCAVAASITPEWVLDQLKKVATADPNELVRTLRINCRHCWGLGHEYQWKEREYLQAVELAIKNKKEPPMPLGGFGYTKRNVPNEDCPECDGMGVEEVFVADSRYVSPAARVLYAGVQKTKDGVKVLMRDQSSALVNLAKWAGVAIDKKELSGPGGGPIPMAHLKAEDLTDEQLAELIAGG